MSTVPTCPPSAIPFLQAPKSVLSIQSLVCYGHVGNSAALIPLILRGLDVSFVPTTLLSNHPQYPSLRGSALDAKTVGDLLRGMEDRRLPATADCLLTGYLGRPETGKIVAEAIERWKAARPNWLYVLDPVMGDRDIGFFIDHALPPLFRHRLLPLATVVTPNQFELEALAGGPAPTIPMVLHAARRLIAEGPKLIAVTGVRTDDTPDDAVDTVLVTKTEAWRVRTPMIRQRYSGTGDTFAALLAGALTLGISPADALNEAVSGIYTVVEATARLNREELALSAVGTAMLARRFPVEAINDKG